MLHDLRSGHFSKQHSGQQGLCWGLCLIGLLLGAATALAQESYTDAIAPSPYYFSDDESFEAYFASIELGGAEAAATPWLIGTTNRIVSSTLVCPSNGCQVVEAKNITVCSNAPPSNSPESIANLTSYEDEELLSDFLQQKNSSSVEVKQWSRVSPSSGRKLLQNDNYTSELLNCTTDSELTLYLTFPRNSSDTKWNETVALFSGGVYLSKMQTANFDLDSVTLLSYQQLSFAPQASNPITNVVNNEYSHIPGPRPAVMGNDTAPGPVTFTLNFTGQDALVTNDTLLDVLYNSLTNNSYGAVYSPWFSPMNTVISSVIQEDGSNRRRLSRRALLDVAPPPAYTANTCPGSAPLPLLSITIKLFQVPLSAVGQVETLVQGLVDQSTLLFTFQRRGLRVCRVALASFSGGAMAPAPSPLPAVFSVRSGSNHSVVVVALSIAIPVSIVGSALITLSVIWYRRNKRREAAAGQAGLRAKKFSGDSSLFGSPHSTAKPEASAQSIIRSLHANSLSNKSQLFDMPWSDWKIDPGELTIATKPDGSEWLLGSGASGRVYKALRNGVQIVAVKVFKEEATLGAITSLTSPKHAEQFKQEISILKHCHDKNIVQFVGACLTVGQPILVTEYLENGDLYKAINSQQGNRYHWYRMEQNGKPLPNSGMGRRVALDVARGLHFLHTRKIVHFDLKSANILLARDFTAKIADVGLARILHDDMLSTRKEVGTFAWAAPEVLLGRRTTEAADIYSFGVLLHELSAVESPQQRQLRQLSIPAEAPLEIADLINRCLDIEPSKRPTARELVAVLSLMPATPPYPPAPTASPGPQSELRCPALMHN